MKVSIQFILFNLSIFDNIPVQKFYIEAEGEDVKKIPAFIQKVLDDDAKTHVLKRHWVTPYLLVKQGDKFWTIFPKRGETTNEPEPGFVKNEITYHPFIGHFEDVEKFEKRVV
jgi:hypothetical protein